MSNKVVLLSALVLSHFSISESFKSNPWCEDSLTVTPPNLLSAAVCQAGKKMVLRITKISVGFPV